MDSIYAKLATSDPIRNLDAFPLESLPNDRNDLLWETIGTNYQLSLTELSALKNSIFDQPAAGAAAAGTEENDYGPVVEEKKKKRSRPAKKDDNVDDDGERKRPRSKLEMLQDKYERIKDALLKFKELKGHMLVPYEFRVPVGDPNWKEDQANLWLGMSSNFSDNLFLSFGHELRCKNMLEKKHVV